MIDQIILRILVPFDAFGARLNVEDDEILDMACRIFQDKAGPEANPHFFEKYLGCEPSELEFDYQHDRELPTIRDNYCVLVMVTKAQPSAAR